MKCLSIKFLWKERKQNGYAFLFLFCFISVYHHNFRGLVLGFNFQRLTYSNISLIQIVLWVSLCSIILHFFLSPTFGCLLKTLMLGVDCFDMLVCFYLCLCATKKARSFWWLLLRWTVCSIFLRVIIAFHYLALFPTFAFSFVPLFCLAFICNDVHAWVFLFCFFTFCTRKKVQPLCDLDFTFSCRRLLCYHYFPC